MKKGYQKARVLTVCYAVVAFIITLLAARTIEGSLSLFFIAVTASIVGITVVVVFRLLGKIEAKEREIGLYKNDLEALRKIDTTVKSQGW